jgi:hypothetical protein
MAQTQEQQQEGKQHSGKPKHPLASVLENLSPLVIIDDSRSKCQYDASCPNESLDGEAFCKDHLNKPSKVTLSGSEPPYEPEKWNTDSFIQKVHNCFAYSLNILSMNLAKKCKDKNVCNTHQPGEKSKWLPMDEKTCPNLIARILGDDSYMPIDYEGQCPDGTSMIAFIIDTKRDYHVLRLDNNGYFSHKGGQGPATDKDAKGHLIADVRLANFNYSNKYKNDTDKLNYTHFCGYFCISRSKVFAAVPKGGRRFRKTRTKKMQLQKQMRKHLQKKKQKQIQLQKTRKNRKVLLQQKNDM